MLTLGSHAEGLLTLWAKCLNDGLERILHSLLLRIDWVLVWFVGDDDMGM